MGERVHRACAQAGLLQSDHQRRVGEHELRADQTVGASSPSGSRWIRVISAPERVVGIAATRPPRTAAIAFADVDHTPAAERDQVGVADVGEQPSGDLVDRPGWDVVKAGRVLGELDRRGAHRALGGQQLVIVEAMLARGARATSATTPGAKVDRALAVAPGEIVACRSRARSGARTHSLLITNQVLHQLSYPGTDA